MFVRQPRFFVPHLSNEPTVQLPEDESLHLRQVLRVQPGEMVALFDGSGWEAWGEVLPGGKKDVVLEIRERHWIDRENPGKLTLAVSLPKGDRQKVLVEKLVELGVHRLVPLVTQRSVAQPTASALERLVKQGIAACKQCGRNRLMEIAPPETWEQFANHPLNTERKWFLNLGGHSLPRLAELQNVSPADLSVCAAIGPEGGWTPSEQEVADAHGWQTVQWGPRIMRVETAAVAVATLFGVAVTATDKSNPDRSAAD